MERYYITGITFKGDMVDVKNATLFVYDENGNEIRNYCGGFPKPTPGLRRSSKPNLIPATHFTGNETNEEYHIVNDEGYAILMNFLKDLEPVVERELNTWSRYDNSRANFAAWCHFFAEHPASEGTQRI